jgi:hypothetical protein
LAPVLRGLDRARRGGGVELVRVVEDACLRGSSRAGVVMRGDCVEELGEEARAEAVGAFLHESKAEVDVAEELSLGRREKERAPVELARAARVVEQRCGEEQVAAQAGMKLRRLAAEGRDADGVLEQAAGVGVVCVGSRRQLPEAPAKDVVADEARDEAVQPRVRDLRGEELEEAVELVEVPPGLRDEACRVGLGRLERAHLELEALAKPLDPAKDPDGVALVEPAVEEVDVAPDTRLDPARRVDELEREVRRSLPRAEALLPSDRVDAFDDPVLGQLRDGQRGGV